MNQSQPWYRSVTRYQWLVLIIASAGWIFDVYEGQIFNITRDQMLADILAAKPDSPEVKQFGDMFLGIFLLGGTIGGLAAGSLADRYGRRPIMILTILAYSLFSGLTFFATELWHVAALRFLVAMGIGGEWAVAASLVAEVFPVNARAHASGIFHASSVLGIWLAGLAGMAVGTQWRYAYLLGVLPALLILWVRASVKEPEQWQARKDQQDNVRLGSFTELLSTPRWRSRALLALALAAVGLGTYWAVVVAGQNLAQDLLRQAGQPEDVVDEKAKFAYSMVQATGAGVGLFAFGPICARLGRRRTFVIVQLLAFAVTPVVCFAPQTYTQLLVLLPVFGFLTVSMHAGYAIYFPELFPTHLRATGTSFCFNGGRILAVPVLFLSGWLKAQDQVSIGLAVTTLATLFLLGAALVLFLPETKGQELPE